MMDVEQQILDLTKEISKHIGVSEGFMKSQVDINQGVQDCLKDLRDKHYTGARALDEIQTKVGMIVVGATSLVTVGWDWILRKFGAR